jgi:hypothetical protein
MNEYPHRIVADAAGGGRPDQVQIEYPSVPHKSIRPLEFAHAYIVRVRMIWGNPLFMVGS